MDWKLESDVNDWVKEQFYKLGLKNVGIITKSLL